MRAANPKFTKRPEPSEAHKAFAAAELIEPADNNCPACFGDNEKCTWCFGAGIIDLMTSKWEARK